VGRAEEQERRIEKHEGVREREVDTGERERIEVVRDPAPSPTAHITFDAMLHEPARFDWAAEVDEAHGLSPIVRNTTQPASVNAAPTLPGNSIPDNIIVDPICTTPNHSAHASPDPAPMLPKPKPTPAAFTDPNLNAPVGFPSITITTTAPANPDHTPPKSATPPIVNDETPTTLPQFIHAPPKCTVNPVPGDVAVDPVRAALAGTIPVDLVNPNSVAANECTHVRFASAVPTDPEPTALDESLSLNLSYLTMALLHALTTSYR
jgi:hypothetical protein